MVQDVCDVANYFLWLDNEAEGDGVSNMKLQKLVYYAQGFNLALFDEPLFDDRIEAWDHGPVVPPLYGIHKNNGRGAIKPPTDFDIECLTADTRELLDEVFEVYGRYSAWHLRSMTHDEPPWKDHYSRDSGGSTVIPDEELARYFKTQVKAT